MENLPQCDTAKTRDTLAADTLASVIRKRAKLTNTTNSVRVSGMRLYAIASLAQLSRAYGVSRQTLHKCHKKYGPFLNCPDELFLTLVSTGRQSPIRTLLSDPNERERITAEIFNL